MKKLSVYKNCSRGGVSTVFRGRAAKERDTKFDLYFELDRGGKEAYDDLPNVSARVYEHSRMQKVVNYSLKTNNYNEISILSYPELANSVIIPDETSLVYEIHSGSFDIVKAELSKLNQEKIDIFRVPSEYSAFNVKGMIKARHSRKIEVVPNLVNTEIFNQAGPSFDFPQGVTPLIWVGRFDKGKGGKYAARLLAQLPEHFHLYMVISLETQPGPGTEFLNEAAALGVSHRVHFRMNLPQSEVAALYRGAAQSSGALVSTSLIESFGYLFAEAPMCGLPVVAFDLPVVREHTQSADLIRTVAPGDVIGMAHAIASLQ